MLMLKDVKVDHIIFGFCVDNLTLLSGLDHMRETQRRGYKRRRENQGQAAEGRKKQSRPDDSTPPADQPVPSTSVLSPGHGRGSHSKLISFKRKASVKSSRGRGRKKKVEDSEDSEDSEDREDSED